MYPALAEDGTPEPDNTGDPFNSDTLCARVMRLLRKIEIKKQGLSDLWLQFTVILTVCHRQIDIQIDIYILTF